MSLGIDDAGYDIYDCHEDRENVYGEASDRKEGILLSQVGYKSELHSLKALHA